MTSTIRAAATVVLVRPGSGPSGHDVALVHRAPGLRFLGDFWSFPGGVVDEGETLELAAVRETLEEVGVLLWPGAGEIAVDRVHAAQDALLSGRAKGPGALAALGLDAGGHARAGLLPAGRWVTPPFGPLRFDARFFLAVAPAGAPGLRVVPGELDRAEWLDPAEALARWARDEALLAPPTRRSLEALAATSGGPDERGWLDRARAALEASAPVDGEFTGGIDFRPGLRVFPVRTPTLPPATHTNCYVVGHGGEVVVIDAASPYEDERAKLDAFIDALAAPPDGSPGRRVRELILTHHHHDHSSGAQHLADRLGVGIAAHRGTAERLEGRVKVTRFIEHGEVIDLPADLPGARPRRLVAHLLEGHADGHLVFEETVTRGVIAGDMVAGTGTIVVDPPEGKMSLYLESLRRLGALDATVLYPAHGAPIGDPRRFTDEYVAHRLAREAKVFAAVLAGAAPVVDLVPRAYAEVNPALYPLAARSLLAHLIKLRGDGRVVEEAGTWRRT